MSVWLDGLASLAEHAVTVTIMLLLVLWGMWVIRGLLDQFYKEHLGGFEKLALSTAGWPAPALFLALFVFLLSLVFTATIGYVAALLIILFSSFVLRSEKLSLPQIFSFLLLGFASLILRFAFLKDMFLPSYFDSAEHYRLIHSVTESYRLGILSEELQGTIYHLGFHFISAGLSFFFQQSIVDVMLVFGQVILAFLPFPVFFLVKRETDSTAAGMFAALLAGFGFHMPQHLMNWGKYPALLSLAIISFVFCMVYLAFRSGPHFHLRKYSLILLGVGSVSSALIHSRTLVIYTILGIAIFALTIWKRQPPLTRNLAFLLVLCTIAAEIFFSQSDSALKLLLEGYLVKDLWMLLLLGVLVIFSLLHFTEMTFLIMTMLALMGLGLFTPFFLPIHGVQSLLDRPYVQMFVHLPFSLLGGLGLAGLIQTIKRLLPSRELLVRFTALIPFGLALINISLHYDFYSSPCCRFATRDDLAVFTWMDHSIPEDATILIASSSLYVASLQPSQIQTGVDAGIWIQPLLARNTALAWQGMQLDSSDVHAQLCSKEIGYIYIGGMPQSFSEPILAGLPEWYAPAFSLPQAKVYRVMGCN